MKCNQSSVVIIKQSDVVRQKEQLLHVFARQIAATVRVVMTGGAKQLLTSDAGRRR